MFQKREKRQQGKEKPDNFVHIFKVHVVVLHRLNKKTNLLKLSLITLKTRKILVRLRVMTMPMAMVRPQRNTPQKMVAWRPVRGPNVRQSSTPRHWGCHVSAVRCQVSRVRPNLSYHWHREDQEEEVVKHGGQVPFHVGDGGEVGGEEEGEDEGDQDGGHGQPAGNYLASLHHRRVIYLQLQGRPLWGGKDQLGRRDLTY